MTRHVRDEEGSMSDTLHVALFGLGTWGRLYWAGPLLEMAKQGFVQLTLVDKSSESPWWFRDAVAAEVEIHVPDLEKCCEADDLTNPTLPDHTILLSHEQLRYASSSSIDGLRDLEAAIVVTGAWDHLAVIRSIFAMCPHLTYLICEKPCGDSMLEFIEIYSLCRDAGVQLVVTDHYLLRPNVQTWLSDPEYLVSVGQASVIEAFMLEAKSDGPPDQDANLDMLVHPLNLLHALCPSGRLEPDRVCKGRGLMNPHAAVTYCFVEGCWVCSEGRIPCRIEVGKQLEDKKELVFGTSETPRELQLGSGSPWARGVWAYRKLLDAVLLNAASSELRMLGGISGFEMLKVWAEMTRIRNAGPRIQRYGQGVRPHCMSPVPKTKNRTLQGLLDLAATAAEAAGRRLTNVSTPAELIEDKDVDDFVTPLDRECEELLRAKLCDKRSLGRDMLFIGEEAEATNEHHVLIESDRDYWIVDPLDGTANAIDGRPEIAVSIALYRGAEPRLGVIHLPERLLTVCSGKNRPLSVNGFPPALTQRRATCLKDATVAVPGDLRKLRDTPIEALMQEVLQQFASIRITGALAYDLAALALGEIDARISTCCKLVDIAAGIQLVESIGGAVSDWQGRPWKPGARLLAAGTHELHAELVALCCGIT